MLIDSLKFTMNFEAILSPFKSLEELLKAIIILNNFEQLIVKNSTSITFLFEKLMKIKLSHQELIGFCEKIRAFPNVYPVELLKNLDKFQIECKSLLEKEKKMTKVVISEKKNCQNCGTELSISKIKFYNGILYLSSKNPGN